MPDPVAVADSDAASRALDRYLLANVPTVITLQKTRSAVVKDCIETAIMRLETVSKDHYDHISSLSTYWEEDDTGARDDSSLFTETISKLQNKDTKVQTQECVFKKGYDVFDFTTLAVSQARGMPNHTRRLFILHYAGHAVGCSTSEQLTVTSTIAETPEDLIFCSHINMTLIRNNLREAAKISQGLDILLILDCCFAAVAGRGYPNKGERVELMAAASAGGRTNAREDGHTFTQHWCNAFDTLLNAGKPFDCSNIEAIINTNYDLSNHPHTFVLREGWGVPITFRALPISATNPTGHTVITAFHVMEDPGSSSMQALISYLNTASIKVTILAALPVSSTLLLVLVPVYLQDMLALPRISLILDM